MSRAKGYRIYRECELSQFRGAYLTAIKGIPKMHEMINKSDMSHSSKRKMKGTIIAIESVLERQLLMTPREESGETFCQGCGAVLELDEGTDEWQFCPVCGQRSRDNWHNIENVENKEECGRKETAAEIRAKLDAAERAKSREYHAKWREENQDKIQEYQRRARERRAEEKERD